MRARVSVIVVVGQLDIGGTERHLLRVLPGINGDAFDIAVYALRGGGPLEAPMRAGGVDVLAPAHHVRRLAGLVRTAWHLLATWRRRRPDVVHFFLPEGYLLGGLCSLLAPPAVRIMSRRSLAHYQRKRPGTRALEKLLHRRMHAVLANARAVEQELLAEGVPSARCAVLYNGVDVPPVANVAARRELRRRLELPPADVLFVAVGNLIPYKGHADLIAALAAAATSLPASWCAVIIGRDAGIGAALRAAADTAGIAEYLHWREDVADTSDYLAAADIAVHPSHEEGFSNAILEAMAAGLPVIATDVGGNGEAVVDGETGLLVPARAPRALADAMVRIASDPSRAAQLGAAGRARVAARFSMDECVRRYRRLYRALAAGSEAPIAVVLESEEADG